MKCRNIPTFPFYWKLFFILMPLAWFLDRSHISPSRSPRFHSLGNNQRATLLSPSFLQISQLSSRSLLFNFKQLGRFHSPPKTSSLVHLFFPFPSFPDLPLPLSHTCTTSTATASNCIQASSSLLTPAFLTAAPLPANCI